MDEETGNDCPNCRERRSTSKIDDAKGPGSLRTTLGPLLLPLLLLLLLLLLLTMMVAMLGYTWTGTNGDTVLRTSLSNAVGGGDLGIGSREELNALDKASEMRDENIDAVRSSETAAQSTEQLRHRRKRRSSREDVDKEATHRSESDDDDDDDDDNDDDDDDVSRPIHSESPSTEDARLADFKRRVNSATSFDAIRDIIQSGAHLKDAILPSSSSNSSSSSSPLDLRHTTPTPQATCSVYLIRKLRQCRRSRSRSSSGAKSSSKGSTTTTTTTMKGRLKQLLKVVQTNTTCSRRSTTIVGQFGLGQSHGQPMSLTVCGPKITTADPSSTSPYDVWIYNRTEKHTEWMNTIKKQGLCRPMEMIVNLEPTRSIDQSPVNALISVKKCRLLYIAPDNEENVTCYAVKKRTKLIPIMYEDENQIRTYIVSDHLECKAITNRSEVVVRKVKTAEYNNATTKGNVRKKKNKSCPWPFEKVNQTRCKCGKTTEGSPGYLRYLTCRNIQKGTWKLEKAQAQCVAKGRCLEPICDKGTVFVVQTRRCSMKFKRRLHGTNRRSGTRKPKT